MENPNLAYEDMLFFERRLTEVISGMQPNVRRWRRLPKTSFIHSVVLTALLLSTAYSAYYWVSDPSLKFISLWESLRIHPMFTSCIILLIIFFVCFGVHKRVVAPKIIALRCRNVLADFCLSCDEHGKLIVRPAYAPTVSPLPSNYPTSKLSSTQQHQLPVSSTSHSFGSGFELVEEDSILLESPDVRRYLKRCQTGTLHHPKARIKITMT